MYLLRLDELHSDKRIPLPAGVHYYLCVSPSVHTFAVRENAYNSWTTWYILIELCIILQEITNLLSILSSWRRRLINLRSPCVVHITVSWIWVIFALRRQGIFIVGFEPSLSTGCNLVNQRDYLTLWLIDLLSSSIKDGDFPQHLVSLQEVTYNKFNVKCIWYSLRYIYI